MPLRTLGIVALAAIVVGCQKLPPMEDFTSSDHKFKARFPGKPKKEARTTQGVNMTVYSVGSRDGIYGVAVADFPFAAQFTPNELRMALDGGEQGVLQNVGGTRKSSKELMLAGKYPGREVTGTTTKPTTGAVRSRMYVVGSRMFEVTVAGVESFANSTRSTEFLDSFQVVD